MTDRDDRDHDDWIAVDWGTSRLRAWRVSDAGEVRRSLASGAGMGTLSEDGFEPALRALLADEPAPDRTPDRPVRVLCCGMVGARQGWTEAPYRDVPCAPIEASTLVRAPSTGSDLDVRIVPGLAQRDPADVMRGEETQIAGLLAGRPGFEGLLCLPGTHTKWVRVTGGRVEGFATAMSGELFALLAGHSTLRHGIAADGHRDDAFDAGVLDALAAPAALTRRLFSLRARGLLDGLDPVGARSRLSGLLLGVELAGLGASDVPGLRPGPDVPVVVVGAPGLAERYARALGVADRAAESVDGERLGLAGLIALHRSTAGEHP